MKVTVTTPTKKQMKDFDKKYPQFKSIQSNQPKLSDEEIRKAFKQVGRGKHLSDTK